MAQASLHKFDVMSLMTTKISPLEFFYVRADPIDYTEKIGFPSVIFVIQQIA